MIPLSYHIGAGKESILFVFLPEMCYHGSRNEVNIMRKTVFLVLLLLLAGWMLPAEGEEIPTLPEDFVLRGLPKGNRYNVYTGPGEEYFVAGGGKAQVSSSGTIWCYGAADERWLLVEYEISGQQNRIGYIDALGYEDLLSSAARLAFADQPIEMTSAAITDDPLVGAKSFGTLTGRGTLLAYLDRDWAYVEGVLKSQNGQRARGFVRRSSFTLAEAAPTRPEVPQAEETAALLTEVSLNLTGTPQSLYGEILPAISALPLENGVAIAYTDQRRIYLDVFGRDGTLLWSESPFSATNRLRLLPAEDGLTLRFWHNYQVFEYTYPAAGGEGTFASPFTGWQEEIFPAAEKMPVPVCRAQIVAETSQGTLILASFSDGAGLYLLDGAALTQVTAWPGDVLLADPADEEGVFTLIHLDGGCTLQTWMLQ